MVPAANTRPRAATVLALDDLEEGVTKLDFSVGPEALDLVPDDVEVSAPVSVHVRIGRSMQMFTIEGRARTEVQGECCRCLAPAGAEVTGEIRFLLQRKQGSDEELEALEEEDDVDLVDPGVKEYDLGERLHDAVILELPLRLYCKTDCKGLCPRCGQDLNVADCDCDAETTDPRWDVLAQLKNQQAADPSGA